MVCRYCTRYCTICRYCTRPKPLTVPYFRFQLFDTICRSAILKIIIFHISSFDSCVWIEPVICRHFCEIVRLEITMEVGYGSLEEPVPTSPQQPQKGRDCKQTKGLHCLVILHISCINRRNVFCRLILPTIYCHHLVYPAPKV